MSEVAATLASLREASATLAGLPVEDRLRRVGAWLDAWASKDSPWQREASHGLARACGFSRDMVREGCAIGFAPYTGDALRALFDRERPRSVSEPSVCAAILAGAIPMPTLLAAAAPLTLGFGVALKASAADPVTPALVARSAMEADTLLGRCVAVVELKHHLGLDAPDPSLRALLGAETVVITGSDESVQRFEGEAPRETWVVPHGHRFSAAVLRVDSALDANCRAIARDVALWDQLGCLSAVGVWVVDREPDACTRVARGVAAALDELEATWPRAPLGPARLGFQSAVEIDAMRADADSSVRLFEGSGGVVVREVDPRPRPVPLHRYLRVYPATNIAEVVDALGTDRAHLAALATVGLEGGERDALGALGPSRMCGVGELQAPPLDWRRDHQGVLACLLPPPDAARGAHAGSEVRRPGRESDA